MCDDHKMYPIFSLRPCLSLGLTGIVLKRSSAIGLAWSDGRVAYYIDSSNWAAQSAFCSVLLEKGKK